MQLFVTRSHCSLYVGHQQCITPHRCRLSQHQTPTLFITNLPLSIYLDIHGGMNLRLDPGVGILEGGGVRYVLIEEVENGKGVHD